jgi:hypothetical protein
MNYTGLKFDGGIYHKGCECKVIKQLVNWDDVYKAHQDFGYGFKKIQDNYIVRCCGKNTIWSEEEIKESIKKILREEAEIPLNVKRRFDRLEKLLNVVLDGSNPCDYSNIEHYFKGVLYDLETFLIVFEMEGMTKEEILSVVENHFYEDIRRYYINSLEDC